MQKRQSIFILFILFSSFVFAQQNLFQLSIPQIMKGKEFIGYWPHDISWNQNNKDIYFYWNKENAISDSLYKVNIITNEIIKLPYSEVVEIPYQKVYSPNRQYLAYVANGNIFVEFLKTGITRQITNTIAYESDPHFTATSDKVVYNVNDNLYYWNINTGETVQVTNIVEGNRDKELLPENELWLKRDQDKNFDIIKKYETIEKQKNSNKSVSDNLFPTKYYCGDWEFYDAFLSPDENYVFMRLSKNSGQKKYTDVTEFVTESGYTQLQTARPKVGAPRDEFKAVIFNRKKKTFNEVQFNELSHINEDPYNFYKVDTSLERDFFIHEAVWPKNDNYCITEIRTLDNKDRWLVKINLETEEIDELEHQRDTAWINGPGIGYVYGGSKFGFYENDEKVWFFSEETGFSNLYTINLKTRKKSTLIKGEFEIYDITLSKDSNYFYFTSNKTNPGERELYKYDIENKKLVQLTNYKGGIEFALSPNEQKIAILASRANEPWELFVMDNAPENELSQLTHSTTTDFESYNWRIPKYIKIKADDGAMVPARLYEANPEIKSRAGIIFVHGAGYLQNAHHWWSDYYHEYMFHNFLADNGFTVLDIDYRGSAGYGRDWRTAIYRNMGGKDLSDQVDGAKYLINELDIDSHKIGIYGGSYGGFITLMAMFKNPGVFQCGAALRAVTDWAHYNHGYTSNILNTPITDSTAYYRSSPIYYAEGLQGKLLICHGMEDDNVQFQDVVRLAQRFIELGKTNWELAVYPIEKHAFKEASSWTDEYSRIYKLFRESLIDNQ